MVRRTKYDNERLNHLVSECITFNLKPTEALEYIRLSWGVIHLRSYQSRRARLKSESSSSLWLSHYTKIGFVQEHHELMTNIKLVQEDRLRQFFIETNRAQAERDERKISLINRDIIENSRLIADLMEGTPIISSIKATLMRKEQEEKGIGEGGIFNFGVQPVQEGTSRDIPPVE